MEDKASVSALELVRRGNTTSIVSITDSRMLRLHTIISVLTLHPWHVPCVALVYHCRGVSADLTTVSTRSIRLYHYNYSTPDTRGVNRWTGVSTLRER